MILSVNFNMYPVLLQYLSANFKSNPVMMPADPYKILEEVNHMLPRKHLPKSRFKKTQSWRR